MFRFSLVLLVGFCTTGGAAASWADSLFEERSRDFGSVPHGPTLTHPYRLTNKGNTTLHISGVRVSCGCVTAQILQSDLEPGQSTAILAQMDTRKFTGPKSVTIYVQFDRPQWEEVQLTIQSNSRDDVTLSPDAISFGQIKRGTAPSATLTLSLLGNGQWQALDARADSNYVQPVLKEQKRDGSEVVYQLTAKLRQDVPVGKWYSDIWVRTTNPAIPKVRVPLTVEVEPALNVTPPATLLGQVKLGETAERKVVVRGAKPFRIVSVKGGDAQLSVRDISTESKQVHVLTVALKATKAGEQAWTLHVLTDSKEDGEVEFQTRANVAP